MPSKSIIIIKDRAIEWEVQPYAVFVIVKVRNLTTGTQVSGAVGQSAFAAALYVALAGANDPVAHSLLPKAESVMEALIGTQFDGDLDADEKKQSVRFILS